MNGLPRGVVSPMAPAGTEWVAAGEADYAEEEVPPKVVIEAPQPFRRFCVGLLDLAVDLLDAVGRAAGVAPLHALGRPCWELDPAPDRAASWLLVLETACDAQQRCRCLLSETPGIALAVRAPRLTTGYWRFRGLGAPLRMICFYTGVDCKDVKYEVRKRAHGGWSAREWEREDKRGLVDRNALVQLPYVVNHTTGEVVSQSSAVCLYLGRLLGLGGASRAARAANEQVLLYIHAMWMEMRDLVYPSKRTKDEQEFKDSLGAHFGSSLPDHYLLDQEEALARAHGFRSPLADFELLEAFHAWFRALPRLQDYFESEDAQL
eukprot:CAMPEP_0179140482 /NCGR_PEP_ID=MMETSP0796-20121207/67270_1 /TAXON_ID=73915 /ORGANISM="Pyrodinium bahamense, Strain pbaha01" /LENGTH=319 /DNA_ID=CAMNT_0020840029 /DNA_START=1 /DNA_END=957 /DNA_ORIENTATION=+